MIAFVLALQLFNFPAMWVETSHRDFADGIVDPEMYVSHRAQFDPDSGCVEFFSRFDVDNNGYYDLACSDDAGPNLTLYMGSDSGYYPANRLTYPIVAGGGIDLADLNLDGWAELIASGWREGFATIYWGTPTGPSAWDTTKLAYGGQGEDVNVYDLDKDGYLDILVGSSDGNLYIFWGTSSGYASSNCTVINLGYSLGHNIEIADFDKDGWGDIALSTWTFNQNPIVYWGPGRQPSRTVWIPGHWNNDHGLSVGDLNKDGWLDLVYTGYDTITESDIYFGSPLGFSPANRTTIHPGQCYGGSALADWNYDGNLDIVYFRGNWTSGGMWKPRVYLNSGTPPYFNDASSAMLGTDTLNASGGFIGDFNFDGMTDIWVNNMRANDSSEILWGPTYNVHTRLPANNDHHAVFREPGNVFDRSQSAFYLSSVYDAGASRHIQHGSATWVSFEPPGSHVKTEFRSGDTPAPDSSWSGFALLDSNGAAIPDSILNRRYLQYQIVFTYSRPCFLPDLERIAVNLDIQPNAVHDVGTTQVLAPAGVILTNTVVVPQAIVKNYGNTSETFQAVMDIGGIYRNTVTVNALPPNGAVRLVSFPAWTAVTGKYIVSCSTMLAGDAQPSNDKATDSVDVRPVFDVAVLQILAPTGSVNSGVVVTPQAVVANMGTQAASFPALFTIGGSYSDNQPVNLNAGETATVSFANWTAQPPGKWAVKCTAAYVNDANPANNEQATTVTVVLHDVGTIQILAPIGSIQTGTVVTPEAIVQNVGTQPETFQAEFKIGGIYANPVMINNLAAGASARVQFPPWTAVTGSYIVSCSTMLAADMNPANDKLIDSVTVAPRPIFDVAVERILAPTGTVGLGSVIVPQAIVHNLGTQSATFPVIFTIGGVYSDNQILTLAANETRLVNFWNWTAAPVGTYPVKCTAAYISDSNPANNQETTSVTVILHDASAIQILAPLGFLRTGDVVAPSARVKNLGSVVETFDAKFVISDGYNSTSTGITLQPGATQDLFFPNWTAPTGHWIVSCSTMLATDMVPSNDKATDSVDVNPPLVFDVAVEQILQPTGQVDLNTVLPPVAVIRNLGTQAATFPAIFTVSNGYSNTQTLTLQPNETRNVNFANWTAVPRGTYAVKCTAAFVDDSNPANNQQQTTVTVVAHDASAIQILAPVGVALTGDRIVPQAIVKNLGDVTEDFPVILNIGTVYSNTVNVNGLRPNATQTLFFPVWTAVTGKFIVACSTMLATDMFPDNDKVIDSVLVTPPPILDVATEQIIAPVGTYDSGATVVPVAVISNRGNVTATFPVRFRIGAFYSDQRTITLAGGEWDTVSFNPWDALERGTSIEKCTTACAGDTFNSNDAISGPVTVRVRDVGAVQILAPVWRRAFDGVPVVPIALIRNYGTTTETFDAMFRIGSAYSGNATVTALAPDSSVQVGFPAWVAVAGGYRMACSTMLATDMDPSNDKVEDSIFVIRRGLTVRPDTCDSVLPGASVNYQVRINNRANAPDTIDVRTAGTRPNWTVTLLDAAGQNPLIDHNGDGLPDVGELAPGETAWITVRVTCPANEVAGVEDTTLTIGRSCLDTTTTDQAKLMTFVLTTYGVRIFPDQNDSVAPGAFVSYQFTVQNLGNAWDLVDLELNRVSNRAGWSYEMLDQFGSPLPDQNRNGKPDIGPLGPVTGSQPLYLRVTAPANGQPGETDTVDIWAISSAMPTVKSRVRVYTKIMALLTSLIVAPDQNDRQPVGTTQSYPLYVQTAGNIADLVNLSVTASRANWKVELWNQDATGPLIDSDADGRLDVEPVIPAVHKPFTLRVTTPDSFTGGLQGGVDSLGKCFIQIVGESRFRPGLWDTATVVIQTIPWLDIHNFENPFRDHTQFVYSIPRDGFATLRIYDRAGQLVSTVFENKRYVSGIYVLPWTGINRSGRKLAPGTYAYIFEVKDNVTGTTKQVMKKLMIK